MKFLWDQLEQSKAYLMKRASSFPKIVVTLGSGLSGLLFEMKKEVEIPYSEIPHWKSSTVSGHPGRLIIGSFCGVPVACLQGRLHFYEGYAMHDVVFPFRALAYAGGECFILTNAAGSLRSDFSPRDLVLITDHINLMGTNPLMGPNEEKLGARFPDMTHLYDPNLRKLFHEAAQKSGVELKNGVYVGIHGPSYETPAEIRMYQKLGADVVGMSTVPEAICLHHMKKKVVGISCITNLAAGVGDDPLDHSEVIDNAKLAYEGFAKVMLEAIRRLDKLW